MTWRCAGVLLGLLWLAAPAVAATFSCAEHGDGTCRDLVPDANAGTPGTLRSVVTVPAGGCSQVVAPTVDVALIHDFVGDLTLRLTGPDGTARLLLDRPATASLPCASDDVAATFADAGAAPTCPHTVPTVGGSVAPVEPLAGFAGKGGAGPWTLEIVDAVHGGTGALDGWSLNLECTIEACDNCVDDDGDGLVDRSDPDCPPPAVGNAGLGGDRGRAATRCQKAIHKAGAALALRRLQRVSRCVTAMTACVQDPFAGGTCYDKARRRCAKDLGALGGDVGRLTGVVQGCSAADLLEAAGLGYGLEAAICAERGVGTLASAADVAACVAALHTCRVDALIGVAHPRAGELVALAGRDPASELPCLGVTPGSGAGLDDRGRGRTAAKCAAATSKATAGFVAKKTKLLQKCAGILAACMQKNDPECVGRARGKCGGLVGKVGGLESRLAGAIAKRCPADVALPAAGLGFDAVAPTCAGVGAPGDVGRCVARVAECRVDQLVEAETPRLRELLGLVGLGLP